MKQRITAILIDHIIGTLIVGVIFISINWDTMINPIDSNFSRPFETFNLVMTLGIIYYLLKDIYRGRSIGKRFVGIAIRDIENSNNIPGIIRLIIRNLTVLIWPFELIIMLLTNRRIGDRIAKTIVIKS